MNGQIDIVNLLKDKSSQIKHLTLVALLLVQSSDFDTQVTDLMIKMGRGDEALKAMFDARLKGQ